MDALTDRPASDPRILFTESPVTKTRSGLSVALVAGSILEVYPKYTIDQKQFLNEVLHWNLLNLNLAARFEVALKATEL